MLLAKNATHQKDDHYKTFYRVLKKKKFNYDSRFKIKLYGIWLI